MVIGNMCHTLMENLTKKLIEPDDNDISFKIYKKYLH